MTDDIILETRGLTKEFKGFVAVENVNLRVRRGTIHALIGPNGAGKTTFFNLLTKFLPRPRGRILFNGRDITGRRPAEIARRGMVRSFQISAVFPNLTCSRTCASRCSAQLGTLLPLLALGARARRRSTTARVELLDASASRDFARHPRGRAPLRPQAHARDRDHARARSGADAARRADRGHGARGRRPHRRTSSRRSRGNRTVLMVEHNLSVVADLSDTHHGAGARRGARRGRLRRVSAQPAGDRGVHGVGAMR